MNEPMGMEYGPDGFAVLMRQLVTQIKFANEHDIAPDFGAYDVMPTNRQDLMREFAFLLHQRLTFMLASHGIRQSLDERMMRISLGLELNRQDDKGPANGPVNE